MGDATTYDIEAWESCGQLRFLWVGLIRQTLWKAQEQR
jgi:hypothetical protein